MFALTFSSEIGRYEENSVRHVIMICLTALVGHAFLGVIFTVQVILNAHIYLKTIKNIIKHVYAFTCPAAIQLLGQHLFNIS